MKDVIFFSAYFCAPYLCAEILLLNTVHFWPITDYVSAQSIYVYIHISPNVIWISPHVKFEIW